MWPDHCFTMRVVPCCFRMVNIYNRLHKAMSVMEYFTMREWEWSHDNMDALKAAMTPEDQKVSGVWFS